MGSNTESVSESMFYIAAMSEEPEGGIYRFRFDGRTPPVEAGFTPVPRCNYLAWSPDRRFLYSTCSVEGRGGAAAFAVGPNGELSSLGTMASGGDGTCHITTDSTGEFLYCANYNSGDFSEFQLEQGRIKARTRLIRHSGSGPNSDRQEAPHTHFTALSPDAHYLIVIDLGIDAILAYPFTAGRGIDPERVKRFDCEPGSGPRHLIFDRTGRLAYLVNELGNSVTALRYGDGEFTVIETVSTLPPFWQGPTKAAAIRLSADEKLLYVSNRGFDSVAEFELDGRGGMEWYDLALSGGSSPRDINFLPESDWFGAANEFSDKAVFFQLGPHGRLMPNGCEITLPRPLHIFW